jgi:hypothetical protein
MGGSAMNQNGKAGRREIAAHHEAGHAVIAMAFLVPVRSASVKPRKNSFGRVITPQLPDKHVDIEIYITLAGPFAHRRFAARSNWLTGDFAMVEKMISGSKGTAAAKEKHLAFLVDQAEQVRRLFLARHQGRGEGTAQTRDADRR